MSAQAGIWNLNGQAVLRDSLANISQAMAEYGPDGEHSYAVGPLGMVHRPFHTTSESLVDQQPYRSKRGPVIMWDGRLDNREELISELRGTAGAHHSDVHIVAAAFDRWDTDCFDKLLGDWAIAIWNPEKRELILARDYIGVKGLFYHVTPSRIVWCNHLAPLALTGDKFTICEQYIAGYLALFPEAHLTPYREIHSVRPGHFLRFNGHNITEVAYWKFDPCRAIRYKTDAEYEEHYRHLFRQAVRRRLRTNAPVLAELSGGFDSSAIVCMADDIVSKEGAETPRIDTFTFLDKGEPDEDDSFYSRQIEDKRGRKGHHAEVYQPGNAFSVDRRAFVPRPGFYGRSEIQSALPGILARGNYRVVLSGLGGDEFNGQALDFRVEIADLLMQLRWRQVCKQLITWSLQTRIPFVQLLLQSLDLLLPTSLRMRRKDFGEAQPWIRREFGKLHRMSDFFLTATQGSFLWRASVRDGFHTLTNIGREMTHEPSSCEDRRYPYLDRSLTDFLTSIPVEQLLRPGDRRSLMRRALRDVLPPDMLCRSTKGTAARCISLTLDRQWQSVESMLDSPISTSLGITDETEFRNALVAAKHGQLSNHIVSLLKALALELWLRHLADRGTISIPSRPTSHTVNRRATPATATS